MIEYLKSLPQGQRVRVHFVGDVDDAQRQECFVLSACELGLVTRSDGYNYLIPWTALRLVCILDK